MNTTQKHLTWLALTLATIFIFALFGPEEAALGAHGEFGQQQDH